MERERVGREAKNANLEADKVSKIQNEVSRKQAVAETELAKAEPAVLVAMSALDALDKSQLGQCKTMSVPPPGVADIFMACMVSDLNLACLSCHIIMLIMLCSLPMYRFSIQSNTSRLGLCSAQGAAGEPQ